MSGDDRRQAVRDAMLEALQHTVGREEHMPLLKQLLEGQVGPVSFAEIADALGSVDVNDRGPTWRAEWVELIETIRRAARDA
jgi:hypothetical protein